MPPAGEAVIWLGGGCDWFGHKKIFWGVMSEPRAGPALQCRRARAIEDAAANTLSVEELQAAISAFSQQDRLRLRKAACLFCGGTGYEWQDLYQEAVVRALEGARCCPQAVKPTVFLANAMRSIATESRKSIARHPQTISLAATGTEGGVLNVSDPTPTAQDVRIARDTCAAAVAALEALFEDDGDAWMVVQGDIEGQDADAIRSMMGWNLTQYATVRRRIRRNIEKAYPAGLPA